MAMTFDQQLTEVTCANCKMTFYLTPEFVSKMQDTHQLFYCPMGHSNFYPQKTEKELLKEKITILTSCLERETERIQQVRKDLNREKLSKIAYKAHFKRLRNTKSK